MKDLKLKEAQKKEIEFWKNSDLEKSGVKHLPIILEQMSMGKTLLKCLELSKTDLNKNAKILELGAGQGWASCIIKNLFPYTEITTTDISIHALESLKEWEDRMEVKIDKYYECESYKTNEEKESIDFIFTFASAHHFIKHDETIHEISRILKPKGHAAYFFEPVSPKFWYPLAFWRVNRKRPEVREDLLIPNELKKISKKYNLTCKIIETPIFSNREGLIETIYYIFLNIFPFLQKFLPRTAIILFSKS